jgi:dihydropteroate synthase
MVAPEHPCHRTNIFKHVWPKQHKLLAILNLTPNSFSDGGRFSSFKSVQQLISFLYTQGVRHLDFGAESTAPSHLPVDLETEWQRFETYLIPVISQIPDGLVISFDTYKPEICRRLMQAFAKRKEDFTFIWNDVSGVVDQEGLAVLFDYPALFYVLNFNLCLSRENVLNHKNFILNIDSQKNFFQSMANFFFETQKNQLRLIQPNRIIYDPGFGFSKSREQNLWLLNAFLTDHVDDVDHGLNFLFKHGHLMLGISRKSFLRSADDNLLQGELKFNQADLQEYQWMLGVSQKWANQRCLFRTHVPISWSVV